MGATAIETMKMTTLIISRRLTIGVAECCTSKRGGTFVGGAVKVTRYDKMVRDRIPEIVREAGRIPTTRTAGDEEVRALLESKLLEELREYQDPASDRVEELADVLEVVYALAELDGVTPHQLEEARRAKAARRGAFSRRIVLVEVRQPGDDG